MPNIASAIKEEIVRLARKELRNETERLKKASSAYRSEIANLKRRVDSLEKQLSRLDKQVSKNQVPEVSNEEITQLRFSAKRLTSQRKKLGLSAADFGTLLNVSAQTIYNWEAEKSRPRRAQLTAIATLRGIGKRQIKARLEGVDSK